MSAYRGNSGGGGGSWVRGGQDYPPYMQPGPGYPHNQPMYQQGPFEGGYIDGGFHQSPAGASPLDNQKRFTGKVTKLVDNYGFVDSEVFFQLRSVKGKFPREGDTVYCEAVFNPKAPVKWSATSVQVQPDDRNGDKRPPNGPPRRRSPRRQSPRKNSPRRPSPRRRQRSPLRRNSPKRNAQKRSPLRDRSPQNKRKTPSLVLNYIDLESTSSSVIELKRRFPNLYIPSDFFYSRSFWQQSFPILRPLNLELSHCHYAVCPRGKRLPGAPAPQKEPSDISYRYQAKVVLISCPTTPAIQEQCFPSDRKDAVPKHPLNTLYFLVGVKDRKFEAIGGPWSPSADGDDPEKPQTLINTAIRTTKFLTGIDLSECTSWPKITEIQYRREKDGEVTKEKVVIFFPDVWRCTPTPQDWTKVQEMLLKEPEVVPEEEEVVPAEEKPQEPEEKAQEVVEEGSDDVLLPDGSDPRAMKVTDLRVELEKRGLGTKGVKQALAERLVEFLRNEKMEAVKAAEPEKVAEAENGAENKTGEETMDVDESKDTSKEAVKPEGEQKEVAPVFELPKFPAIVVTPNRDLHRGKFDCRLLNFVRLLEYNESDNKEYSFELNIFCELFKSMFYRDHAFNLYKHLVEAPDLNKEQETRTTEKKKREELKKDDKEDPKTAEADEIEIEIKDEVDEDYEKIYDDKTIRNPSLMMACIYFDLARVGHLTTKEVEDIILSLNLKLSRAQIRNVLKKVVEKDGNFVYKKLTNRVLAPEEPPEGFESHTPLTAEDVQKLLMGNSDLLEETSKEPCVFVDDDKLKDQLEKSERLSVELGLEYRKSQEELERSKGHGDRLKKERDRLESDLSKAQKTIQDLTKDLRLSRNFSHDIRKTTQNAKGQLQNILNNLTKCLEREKRKDELAKEAAEQPDGEKSEVKDETGEEPKIEEEEDEVKIEGDIEAEVKTDETPCEVEEPPTKKMKQSPAKANGKGGKKKS